MPEKALSLSGINSDSDHEHPPYDTASTIRPRRADPVLVAPPSSHLTVGLSNVMSPAKRRRSPYEPECQGPLCPSHVLGSFEENAAQVYSRAAFEGLNGFAGSRGSDIQHASMLRLPKCYRVDDPNKSSSSAISIPATSSNVLRADLSRLAEALARVEEQVGLQQGIFKSLEKRYGDTGASLTGSMDAFRTEVANRSAELKQGQESLRKQVSTIQGDISAIKTTLASLQGCSANLESSVQLLVTSVKNLTTQQAAPAQATLATNAASHDLAPSENPFGTERSSQTSESGRRASGGGPFSFAPASSLSPGGLGFGNPAKPPVVAPSPPASQPWEFENQGSKPLAGLSSDPPGSAAGAAGANPFVASTNPFAARPNVPSVTAHAAIPEGASVPGGVFSAKPSVSTAPSAAASETMFGNRGGGSSAPNPFAATFANTSKTGSTTVSTNDSSSSGIFGAKPSTTQTSAPANGSSTTTENQASSCELLKQPPFSFESAVLSGSAQPPTQAPTVAPSGPFSFSPAGKKLGADASSTLSSASPPPSGFSFASATATSTSAAPGLGPGTGFGSAGPKPAGTGSGVFSSTHAVNVIAPAATASPFGANFPPPVQQKDSSDVANNLSGADAKSPPASGGFLGSQTTGTNNPQNGLKNFASTDGTFTAAASPFAKAPPAVSEPGPTSSGGFGGQLTTGAAGVALGSSGAFAAARPSSTAFGGAGGAPSTALGGASLFSFAANPNPGASASSPLASNPFAAPVPNPTPNAINNGFGSVGTASAPAPMNSGFATGIQNNIPFGNGPSSSSTLDGSGGNASQILGTKKRRLVNRRY